MDLDELRADLVVMREFLVERWVDWGEARGRSYADAASAVGMCRFTSAFLLKALGPGWRLGGGDPFVYRDGDWVYAPEAGGYRKPDGRVEGHYWVVRGDLVVDLTASQFGGETIVLTDRSDRRYIDVMTPRASREALRDVSERARSWHGMWSQLRAAAEHFAHADAGGCAFAELYRQRC